jgi:hypothetical protein
MATWNSDVYKASTPPGTGHGPYKISTQLHATVALPATAALNDVINFGYLPNNAVVVGAWLKAQSQLDSNGAPALTLDLGVTGTAQLFKAAISTVGRAVGVTSDNTVATTGGVYKNTSGAKQLVIGTIHAAAATPVAGNLEACLEYFVEDASGSPA